ncbi:MAG TPA: polysaccharide pyruvyl transferase family protein [Bacteroidales bacterium]|nr:polysaccharide pyruvyl transferase family protein [Bacteroidales bacterium]
MKTEVLQIGILTFHRCINYGSYWQARSLAEALQRRGHNVSILDHRSGRVDIAEWKCAMQPVLPIRVPESDRRLYRSKIEKFFSSFSTLPLSPSFPLDNPSGMRVYDVIIVGSDEVWNLSHPWYGKCPVFFGEGLKSNRIIAYAGSFGNYSSQVVPEDWAKRLRRFNNISARDENSFNIIRNVTGINPTVVLDPCLLFPGYKEMKNSFTAREPFAAVYGHNFSASFIQKAKKWAKQKKIPLVSIGYRNDWADQQWINAGPSEYVSFIKQSEVVFTNFFHGCIFSLVFLRPFICETSSYRSIKVTDLMIRIKGEHHLVSDDTADIECDTILSEPISTYILNNIERLRKISNEYLDQNLKLVTAGDSNEKILQSEEYC